MYRRFIIPFGRRAALFIVSLICAGSVGAIAHATPVPEPLRAFERVGRIAAGSRAQALRAVPVARATGVSVVAVSASWSSLSPGAVVTVGVNSYTMGTDAFAAIQDGIDAVDPNGTVKVLPGAYTETASGRTLFDATGPYQFGLFFGAAKGALTLQGVSASGVPITSAAGVLATITTNSTADFGPDGIWVEGDGVTITGVRIGTNLSGQNKTLEVIGDAFTMKWCDIADIGGSLYMDDWRYDTGTNTSHVKTYRIEGNNFQDGVSMDIASGTGASGPASGRVITGNAFHNGSGDYWPMISFNGADTGVPWFVYTVGGAQITGNTFANLYPDGQQIRTRGTVPAAQFDWANYWSANTFDRKVAVGSGATPLTNLTTYSYPNFYGIFSNNRRIGSAIQGEVDHGNAGDVVLVGGGTYVEQVVVSGKNLTVQGAGRSATTLQSPDALPVTFTTSDVNHAVFYATGAADVRLTALTVDGAGKGAGNYRFVGAAWYDAGGRITDCDVVHVRENPYNGDQHGNGLYVYETTAAAYAFEMGNTNIADYQKNGTVFYGPGLAVNLHDCSVTGQGPTALIAQNGLEFYNVGTCSVSNVTVTGNFYTPASVTSTGLLALYGGTVNLSGNNVFTGDQSALYYVEASGSAAGCHVTGASWAANFEHDQASMANRAARAAAGRASGPPAPSPFDGAPVLDARVMQAMSAPLTASVTDGCLTGMGDAGSQGVWAYSAGAATTVSVSHMEISGFTYGIQSQGAATINADHNAITGNLVAGFDNTSGAGTQVASLNWWGAAGGPGTGGANPVTGSVAASPWLISGADTQSGCGFLPGPDNMISMIAPSVCVTAANSCVDIPVVISRTTSDNVRGFSVKVQLSGNLTLCSATEDTYLSSVSGTQFQAFPLGGNLYEIDGVILGLPCGATAASGGLFTLHVGSSLASGTGTVTITSVSMRDCSNGTVAASSGGPVNVSIDNVGPAAVTALSAAQVKTGNTSPSAPGVTAIALSWPAVPAGTSVRIYRKGFGHYPEYDDGGGAVPAAPGAYPPAGWQLAGVVASGTTFIDKPTTRDFWYYIAYTQDACGVVGPVSPRTNGTLDYHLGDIAEVISGVHVGNDHVDLADVSNLGFHYGAVLAPNDPLDYLDVGPTTDHSVNARPTTDHLVQFEDLILFAINYEQVSAPQLAGRPAASEEADALGLTIPALPAVGETFAVGVQLHSKGDVKAVSLDLTYDADVVEPIRVDAGALLTAQHVPSVALSARPGNADVAMLGTDETIVGDGEVAQMFFRVKSAGPAAIAIARVQARDAANRSIKLGEVADSGSLRTPVQSGLGSIFPNPVRDDATIEFRLPQAANVSLDVYDLSGRHVARLVHGSQPAGVRLARWSGRSDAGQKVAAGMYLVRMEAAGISQTRRILLVR
jgi:hypothetical protein